MEGGFLDRIQESAWQAGDVRSDRAWNPTADGSA